MPDVEGHDAARRVREIFDLVADLAEPERKQALDSHLLTTAESDAAIRKEVERLIAFRERSGILDTTLISTVDSISGVTPALERGEVLGSRFRVIRMIGSGGMGEVYEVEDLTVGQTVALKTIRGDIARDAVQVERFRRELRISRNLAHRNLCKVFHYDEIDRANGDRLRFYTMELLHGETLDQRLVRMGRLSAEAALKILGEIAAGLSEVHRNGIIHRDLKPSNIFLVRQDTGAEHAVVMDFGLARNLTDTEARQTRTGIVMGTFLYMSPELSQAASVASDVYSFGVTALEMVTGLPSPLVAPRSIVRDLDPAWDKALLACFQLNPAERPASPLHVVAMLGLRTRRWKKLLLIAVGVVVCLGLAVIAWVMAGSVSVTAATTQITHDAGMARDPATSADGRFLAYSSDKGSRGDMNIWVRDMETGEVRQVTDDPGDEIEPTLSPDGQSIVWRSDREDTLYLRAVAGGEIRMLAKHGYAPRFSPDGKCVAYWSGVESDQASSARVWITPIAGTSGNAACGSAPRMVASEFADARIPSWSEDGQSLIFRGVRTGPLRRDSPYDLWTVPVGGGSARATGIMPRLGPGYFLHESTLLWKGATLTHPSRLYFAATPGQGHGINLFAMSLLPIPGFVPEGAHQITTGGRLQFSPAALAGDRIAYADLNERINIYAVDAAQTRKDWIPTDDSQMTNGDSLDTRVSASHDGKVIVFGRKLGNYRYTWVADIHGGRKKETQLTFEDEQAVPFVSPDGRLVAISATGKDGRTNIRLVDISSSRLSVQRFSNRGELRGWLPGAREVLYIRTARDEKPALVAMDISTGAQRILLAEAGLNEGAVSPDGKALAYTIRSGVNSTLFVTGLTEVSTAVCALRAKPSLPDNKGVRLSITAAEGRADKMAWSDDSKILFFTSMSDGFHCIWKREIDSQNLRLNGESQPVLHLHHARYSMHALNPNSANIAFGGGRLFFSISQRSSNIWGVQP